MPKKPLILVTNDDGITAPGIRTLIKVMNSIGDVVVVAPDSPQSGMGHAITINDTLYCKEEHIDEGPQKEYSTSGTPADCVKLAVHELLGRQPDLCVSGINHGSNSSINVIYSGTMSAAIEAGIRQFDASIAGLGGCPFAPGATGNVATEDVVLLVEQMGYSTGIDMGLLLAASDKAKALTGTARGGHAKTWLEQQENKRGSK